MASSRRAPALTALTALGAVLLAGCSGDTGGAAPQAPAGSSSGSHSAASSQPAAAAPPDAVATVAGYPEGEFPPVPVFVLPDVTPLTSSQAAIGDALTAALGAVPGLEVSPARCTDPAAGTAGVVAGGSTVLDGEGGGVVTGEDGTTTNGGDGSGVSVSGTATVVNNGDGTGSYSDSGVTITVGGGGSGTWSSADLTVVVGGDGSGSRSDAGSTTVNDGDGSGSWSGGGVTVVNNGDGSGSYTDASTTIVNDGRGTALVDGVEVAADPLAPVAPVGAMPPVEALAPIGPVCGTLVRLPGDVLFDFDEDVVRPDAAAVLDALAAALAGAAPTGPVRVDGHTDGFGDDAYNQALSERRAAAVVRALQDDGVTAPLQPQGFGETRPVAAEVVDGHDDPGGRQLNRRVELVLP